MKRFPSMKKNSDFQRVYKQGRSYANRLFVMYVEETGKQETLKDTCMPFGSSKETLKDTCMPFGCNKETRIGISVSKKVGNSVVRHRMCRLVREIFRLNKHRIRTGLNIIIVVRPAAKYSDFHELESAYLHLCGLHNIKLESK